LKLVFRRNILSINKNWLKYGKPYAWEGLRKSVIPRREVF
jgi:hypothetical protein